LLFLFLLRDVELQAGEVGVFGRAAGGSEKGFEGVAAGQRIVPRIGDGAADGNATIDLCFRR
jgi:hypothetical protein